MNTELDDENRRLYFNCSVILIVGNLVNIVSKKSILKTIEIIDSGRSFIVECFCFPFILFYFFVDTRWITWSLSVELKALGVENSYFKNKNRQNKVLEISRFRTCPKALFSYTLLTVIQK